MKKEQTKADYLKQLKKDAAQLSKNRKHYKLQSEWHRLMYAMTLEIEILERK